jgi:hypothetical protein
MRYRIFSFCFCELLLSATYFFSIPDTSDDDHAGSSHENDLTAVSHAPRRLRCRIPSVPMSFCTQRKHLGKKRSRRYDNGMQVVYLKYGIYSVLDTLTILITYN